MDEIKCKELNIAKLLLKCAGDFAIIFILLYLISFIESIVANFKESFAIVFNEKFGAVIFLVVLSLAIAVTLAVLDISIRCVSIRYDEEKAVFVRKRSQTLMYLGKNLTVSMDIKKNWAVMTFHQDKKNASAYLEKEAGIKFYNFLLSHNAAAAKTRKKDYTAMNVTEIGNKDNLQK